MSGSKMALETERLLLRPFVEDDWRAVHGYAADLEVCRYMPWGPSTEESTREFIKSAIANQDEKPRISFPFAVILKPEQTLIGGSGIHISSRGDREGWIGYCINRRHWGQGYGTEAAEALVGFGFKQLDLHRIFATCDPENVASRRVLEKIGMTREGHLRQHKWQKGKWRDSFLYAILENEWRGP